MKEKRIRLLPDGWTWLRQLMHRHRWYGTMNEEPGFETEQVCRCGAMRRRRLEEIPSGFPPRRWPFWEG